MAKYLLVSFKRVGATGAIVLREKIDFEFRHIEGRQQARLVPRDLAAQEGAGAAHRRPPVAIPIERHRRIPG